MGDRARALTSLLLISVCVPPPASSLHRWAELEVTTNGICHYGNRVDCCWGWRRESWGRCKPVCESGCKHGECVGPDQCRCRQGYTGKTCNQDVNECGLKPRPCKHRCINMVGTYKCYCLTGYMMMPDGTCRNGHTCAMANCQYGCAVMKGEVVCQCPSPGLELGPDRRTCVDIDECVTGMAKCPKSRKCVNTFGSYLCKCHKGFELRYVNGKYQCTDKKEHSFCRDKPDSKICKCKPGTNGWRYDCTPPIIVVVDPARPPTTPAPTTRILTVTMTTNLPSTTRGPGTTLVATTTTTTSWTTTLPTTTSTTSTTAASTEPTTVTTTTEPTTVTTTTEPTTVTTTTEPTTVTATTEPTTVTATTEPTTVTATTEPTTVTATTEPTTVTATTEPTTVTTTTEPTTVTTTTPTTTATTTSTTTTAATTTSTTVPQITTTLDNRIWDITQRPRGDVHIPKNSDQNVFEYFDIELGNTAEFARDNPGASSLSCSFDQGMCRWMSDQEGDLPWETVTNPTGGRYLSVPEPKNVRSFRGARLTIPLAPPTLPPWKESDLCLTFKHNLQGHLIGSLQLFARKGWGQSPAIWTRTGGPGWRRMQITLWRRGLESVVFKAERRRGRKGEIAIDDVSLHRGTCGTKRSV